MSLQDQTPSLMNPAARNDHRANDLTKDSDDHQPTARSPESAQGQHERRLPSGQPEDNPVFRSLEHVGRACVVPMTSLLVWGVLRVAHVPSAGAMAAMALLALTGFRIARQLAAEVSAHSRALEKQALQTRLAIAERRVLSTAHAEFASLVRSLTQSRSVLARSTERAAIELLPLLEDVVAACQRARRQDTSSAFLDIAESGYAPSSVPMDRWARVERTPAWWPIGVRELWAATAASWLDSIRLLHTREVERVALAGTLLLRASIVAIAPFGAAFTISGVVPFAPHVATWRDATWAFAAGWAGLSAVAASWLVWRVIDEAERTTRVLLLVSESAVAAATLVAVPSWMTAAFVAGPLNWAMRPTWRLRRLSLTSAALLAVFAIGLVLAPEAGSTTNVVLEVALGVACVGVISDSFGLLFPIVAWHVLVVLPARHRRAARFQQQRWRERVEPILTRIETALRLGEISRPDSPAVAEATAQLLRAREHLGRFLVFPRARPPLFRRRTVGQVLETVLQRVEGDPTHPLRTAAPAFNPAPLAQTRTASWRVANHLEVALSRIVAEALRHGEFEIRCICNVAEGDIVIRVENDVPPAGDELGQDPGRGGGEISAAIAQLPRGRVLERGLTGSASGVPVFVVEFAFQNPGRRW